MDRFRRFLDARLQPPYVTVVAAAVIVLALIAAITMFVTADKGTTRFGIPLGADFAGFYVAAQILEQDQAHRLYDRHLHYEMYHKLLPNEDESAAIPYVHPPFVAGALQPLARLPYPVAVAIWLTVTAVLYVAGILILLSSLSEETRRYRGLVVLLACSFEPFLFECWLGGQLSAIAFFSYASSFALMQRERPVWAGCALGLCFYKPTLLILILPMLLAGRCWRFLCGMTITGTALLASSLLLVGWSVNRSYLDVLVAFRQSTAGGDLEIRTWKYVDLNNCLRLILGDNSPLQLPLLAALAAFPFAVLAWRWWSHPQLDSDRRALLWAATLAWIPVLNLYVGAYDSILIVQSALIMCAGLLRTSKSASPLTDSGIAYLLMAIYLAPWFSQQLAAVGHIQIYTLLLICLGCWQFAMLLPFSPKQALERQVPELHS